MSQARDHALSLGARASLQIHLALCRGCRAFNGQLEFLRRAMRELSTERN